tara:strand:- start:300 stop:452 length:153 start_codon:yes stop_codon:yes gene_type:complete
LKVDLDSDDMHLIIVALENLTIKGKDAHKISKFLTRISLFFKKQVDKDSE